MKFKIFLASFLIASLPFRALAETPRPIFASALYNGAGYLYVPTVTPFGDRACYFDQNSTAASSITTGEELAFVHGVTSNIQAQINSIVSGMNAVPAITNTVSSAFAVPALTNNYILNVNTFAGGVTITFPNASSANGFCLDVKNISTNTVTNVPQFGQTIEGAFTSLITGQNNSTHYCAVGGNWFIY